MTKIVRRLVVRYQLQYVGSFGFHQYFGDGKMKKPLSILACTLVIGFATMSSHAWAQAQTAKACTEEWRADKAGFQAKGITEKAYVAACRAGTVATPATAPTPAPPTAAPAPVPTTAAPAPAPSASRPSAQTPYGTTERSPSTGSPSVAGQFANEAQAKATCLGDTVVWVNLRSKIYHFAGTHNYGNTKDGAYMCERDTAAQGMRAAKNEQHP
jgi:hypothetical protein